MRISLNLAFSLFLFIQLSFSQEVNYRQVTQIIIGDYHTEQDVEIIKEDILNNNTIKNDAIQLLRLDRSLNETVDIGDRKINKSCSSQYIAKEKDKILTKQLYDEVQALKKKHEDVGLSNTQINKLNKKIKISNEMSVKQNEAVDNYKMCINTQIAIRKDYNKIIDRLYASYTIKKTNTIANND